MLGTAIAFGSAHAQAPRPWSFFGGDLYNSRSSLSSPATEHSPTQINPVTANRLALKWSYSTVGDVSATPTVEQGGLYVPDAAGWLYKLSPDNGALIWQHQLSDYTGSYGNSHNSPAIGAMGEIVLGIASGNGGAHPGARVISVNRTTGTLNWQTVVDTTANSYVRTSPVIYNGRVYIGVASNEELLAANTSFTPTFRGSIVALNEATGAIDWRFSTAPAGYTGASVWGSNPVIWPAGQSIIIGTGNNVSIPAAATQCLQAAGSSAAAQIACLDPTDYVDSMLSLDLNTGRLNWSRRFEADTWTGACGDGGASCAKPAGLDDDFASAPNMAYEGGFIGVPDDRGGTSNKYLLGAGQKSGYYRGLNPSNGGLFWATRLGQGQILWGSALNTDDYTSAYVALYNAGHFQNTLAGVNGVTQNWNAGAWASVNLLSGIVKWQIPAYGADLAAPQYGGAAPGPLTFTNRVLFAGSTSGYMVALDANTGSRRWSFNAGGPVISGPAIYNETVFWGAGSNRSGPGAVHKVFAFAVPN